LQKNEGVSAWKLECPVVVWLKAGVLAEPVLVGRERELEVLESFLNSAVEGKGKTVFISGEAGAGKTRVAREFLNIAKKKGVAVLAGWCLSDAAAPYFPFVEAFNSYFASLHEEEQPVSPQQLGTPLGLAGAAQILSEERGITAWLTGPKPTEKPGKPEALSPQVWKDQVFAGVAKTLHAISVQEPIILFIEDIHWADSASLALLHYVARAVKDSERILVLATFRGEELTADAEGHPHPLAEALRMMRREDLFTEIELSNLSQADVSKIAENLMGGSLQSKLAEKLTVESRGNPLFVVESLRMLFERKSIVQENDQWRLAVDELGIPSKVKDIILRRLAVLKYAQRRVLDAASVIGEKFDAELLSTVLGLDSLEVLETLNVIAHSTSLVCVEENFYRFDHMKSRDAIYEEIPLPLKKGYHARMAERLESIGKTGQMPWGAIAYHYAQAGNKEKAVENALAAGQDALERFSNTEAIKHFAYVLQTIPESLETAAIKSAALEGLGDAYFANRRYTKAFEVFERLADSETGKVRLRAYRKGLDAFFWGPHDFERLRELAKQAEQYAIYDRLENARIRLLISPTAKLKVDRIKEINAVLQVFEEEYSLPDVARALAIKSLFQASGSPYNKSLSDSQRSIAMRKELCGDSGDLASALTASAQVFLMAGLLQEAQTKLTELLRIGEKVGDYHNAGLACAMLNRLLEVWGKTEEALSMSLKGFEHFEKTDAQRRTDRMYADLARQYAKLGDLARAEEYIRQMTSLAPIIMDRIDPEGFLNKRDSVRSQAVFFAATNRWKEAYQYLEKALEITKMVPVYYMFSQVVVRTDYAWVLNKQGRTEEAQVHLEKIRRLYDEVDREFAHVSIDANVLTPWNVVVGEEFEMRLDLVNISRKTGLLIKAEKLVPLEFELVNSPTAHTTENGSVDLKEEKIGPFEVKTIKLRIKAPKPGSFNLNPQVTYIDESGGNQACKSNTVTITVKPAQPKFETLPGRITTGFEDLDALLFGGIPEKYNVALVAPSIDEREQLIKKFLEAGARLGETTFFVTIEPEPAKTLAEEYPSNFFLFVCNPQADALIQSMPNVFKLKGVENLTNIDIELVKAFRTLAPTTTEPRRICIEIISDVLLQHHAVNTRRWLNALLPTLKSRGFTILAVIDSQIHQPEELQTILSLFDGEIRIAERETAQGTEKTLRIRKLYNKKYLENELILTKERLQQ
jgi:tetratricopeptide (TPR) repeat protein/KaiC/GvpD/RAD55 family RecA-like ATPase